MTNFAQERFDIGTAAAHLLNEVRDITLTSGSDIDDEYAKRSANAPGVDKSMKTLNRLYVRHENAWTNYHIYKSIADTIFSSFMPDLTSNSGLEEYEAEVAGLMSGVNGFPEVVHYPFIDTPQEQTATASA